MSYQSIDCRVLLYHQWLQYNNTCVLACDNHTLTVASKSWDNKIIVTSTRGNRTPGSRDATPVATRRSAS